MNELTDLKALLEERARIDKEIDAIRDKLREALALIGDEQLVPSLPPSLYVAPQAPPPLQLPNHYQASDEECVLYDCHNLAKVGAVYCPLHAA